MLQARKTKVLETGAAVLQDRPLIEAINAYLGGFHAERPVRPLPRDALPVQAACAALALPPDLAIIVNFSSVAFSSARVSSSSGSASL